LSEVTLIEKLKRQMPWSEKGAEQSRFRSESRFINLRSKRRSSRMSSRHISGFGFQGENASQVLVSGVEGRERACGLERRSSYLSLGAESGFPTVFFRVKDFISRQKNGR
jgi:hypothetical protein